MEFFVILNKPYGSGCPVTIGPFFTLFPPRYKYQGCHKGF